MRKYFIALPLILLFFLFSLNFNANAACQGLPPIPVTIAPTEGDFNTNYAVTIEWEGMNESDFKRYEDIDVYFRLFNAEGIPINAGTDNVDKYYGRQQENSTHILNSLFISAGTYKLTLHLFPQFGAGKDQSCVFEKEAPSIIVTSTLDPDNPTASTLKVGDPCDPNLQASLQFTCPGGSYCNPVEANNNSKWICKSVINKTTIKENPSPHLTPCSQWEDADGNLIPTDTPQDKLNKIDNKKCIAVNTAIGIVPTESQEFVKFIFSFVLGIAGGIALILIMISGYRLIASQGNPEAIKAAQDQLASTIIGLLFIIFAFVILQVIGVDLLKIPGFQS